MKKIDKNSYKEATYGKKHLMCLAIVLLILALGALGGGITLIVLGAMSGVTGKIIWMVILGVILAIIGVLFGIFAFTMLFTSAGMIKNQKGSVKDGNRAIGTANIVKCDKCGEELPDNATFCSKCGAEVEGIKKCECGTINKSDAQYCTGCGRRFE